MSSRERRLCCTFLSADVFANSISILCRWHGTILHHAMTSSHCTAFQRLSHYCHWHWHHTAPHCTMLWWHHTTLHSTGTGQPKWLKDLAQLLPIGDGSMWDLTEYAEIYPGSKLKHFKKLSESSGTCLFTCDEALSVFFSFLKWNPCGMDR